MSSYFSGILSQGTSAVSGLSRLARSAAGAVASRTRLLSITQSALYVIKNFSSQFPTLIRPLKNPPALLLTSQETPPSSSTDIPPLHLPPTMTAPLYLGPINCNPWTQTSHIEGLAQRTSSIARELIQGAQERHVHPAPLPCSLARETALPARDPSRLPPPLAQAPHAPTPLTYAERTDSTDWKQQADQSLAAFSEKVTLFGLFYHMYSHIQQKEADDLILFNLVSQATSHPTLSPWEIFEQHCPCENFWIRARCKMFYFFAYQTSFAQTIVNTYLKEFLQFIRKDLASCKEIDSRGEITSNFLHEISSLLDDLDGATRQYAEGHSGGDLDAHRKAVIEARYGHLDQLCKDFSSMLVRSSSKVMLFPSLYKIPYIGSVLHILVTPFNWTLNVCLRLVMRFFLLPQLLKQLITTTIDATASHKILFAKTVTEFLTQEIISLREEIHTMSLTGTREAPGAEKLPEVVAKFFDILEISQCKTRAEIQRVLEQRKDKLDRDPLVTEKLKEGFILGGHLLLDHVTNPANQDKIFFHLFETLNSLLSDPPRAFAEDPNQMMLDFKASQAELKDTARGTFQMLIEKTLQNELNPLPEKDAALITAAFDAKKQNALSLVEQFQQLWDRMREKITLRNAYRSQESTQPEIYTLSQLITDFSNTYRMTKEWEHLDPASQEGLKRSFTPFYAHLTHLMQTARELFSLEDQAASFSDILSGIAALQETLHGVNALDLQETLANHIQQAIDLLKKHLPPEDPNIIVPLSTHLALLEQGYQSLQDVRKTLQAIEQLYPPIPEGASSEEILQKQSQGHLFRLGNLIQHRTNPEALRKLVPPGYTLKKSLASIRAISSTLKESDQQKIFDAIQQIQTHPEDFSTHWSALVTTMQEIIETYRSDYQMQQEPLQVKNGEILSFLFKIQTEYQQRKETLNNTIQETFTRGSSEMTALKQASDVVVQEIQHHLSPDQWGPIAAGLGLVAGGVLGPVGGAVLSTASLLGTHLASSENKSNAVLQTGAGAALAGVATAYLPTTLLSSIPYIGPLLGYLGNSVIASRIFVGATTAAATGVSGTRLAHQTTELAQQIVIPEIMRVFDQGYAFLLSPHLSRAALMGTMRSLAPEKARTLADVQSIFLN